ncbi:MAG: chemotaxis protein CheW [Thermodesulfobacteriota bacterium]
MESDSNNEECAVLQLVAFNIGEEEFSVPILNVQEIIRMSEITRVPHTSEFIGGVINLRGKVIPIVDLRSRFGIDRFDEGNNRGRIVVINSEERVVGLVVDSVSEILRMDASIIEPPPDFLGKVSSDYINGVGKLKDRLIVLLNLEKVLDESDVENAEPLGSSARERGGMLRGGPSCAAANA